jgi:hypothetical protein
MPHRRARAAAAVVGPVFLCAAFIVPLMLTTSVASARAADAECANVDERGYLMQQNLHASEVLVECGVVSGGDASISYGSMAAPQPAETAVAGNLDLDLITGTETLPHVTQAGSMIAVNGNDVAVAYNDTRLAASGQLSGISVSHDGGASFTRSNPSPFAAGHGSNIGGPVIVYNVKLATWFAGWLTTGCGGGGIGLWTATNPDTWTPGVCAVAAPNQDRESMWVDNTPTSPFYGRMYISYNDFAGGFGQLKVTHSDNGTMWSAPVTLSATFLREVQLTGAADGTVFQAALNENGGGVGRTGQQNLMFKSTDGGATWNNAAAAAIPGTFTIPGDTACTSYFPKIQPIWRQTGYGIPGVGPGGVVHYDYAAHGVGADEADVFYIRSTDNGATWEAPIRLDSDASGREQWMPSLSVTPSGIVVASWYDRRNTTDGVSYQRFIRISLDNGATWEPDRPVTPIIPQPNQPDPNLNPCFAGDYNYPIATDTTVFDSWTDGRVSISPNGPQQDVFASAIRVSSLVPTLTVSPAGTGAGTISGPGINCPGDCTEDYTDGTAITLTATTGANSSFAGFGGSCSGVSCSLTMDDDKSVSATFPANPPDTKITKTKLNKKTGKVKFAFKGTGAVTGFECALKKAKKPKRQRSAVARPARFRACSSPRKYKLKVGKSKFFVRAVGPGGRDPSPAKKAARFRG